MDGYRKLTMKTVYVLLGVIAFAKEIAATALTGDLRIGLQYFSDGFVNVFGWVGFAISAVYYLSKSFGFDGPMCEYFGYLDLGIGFLFRFVSFSSEKCEDEKEAVAEGDSQAFNAEFSLEDDIGDVTADGKVNSDDLKMWFDTEYAKLTEEEGKTTAEALLM